MRSWNPSSNVASQRSRDPAPEADGSEKTSRLPAGDHEGCSTPDVATGNWRSVPSDRMSPSGWPSTARAPNAIHLPSDDHAGDTTSADAGTMRCASLPSMFTSHNEPGPLKS